MGDRFETHARQDSGTIVKAEWTPLVEGERWECVRCGWCCRQPWAVNVTWSEFRRAEGDPRFSNLGIDRLEIDEPTGRTHPYFVIEGACPLLDQGRNLCTVHPEWFYTCATWPFLMLPDSTILVNRSCRGFGSGPRRRAAEVREKVLQERSRAGIG